MTQPTVSKEKGGKGEGREGIGRKRRKGKENGNRPNTSFDLKVALQPVMPVLDLPTPRVERLS